MTSDTRFENGLKKLILEEIERLKNVVSARQTMTSFEIYHYHVGQIDALKRVIESYCGEVNSKINEG